MRITTITARQILDSRGNPTVEADVLLEDGSLGRAAVPSGASTGSHEVLELRDASNPHYGGKSVEQAVANVKTEIAEALKDKTVFEQNEIDSTLLQLDGTANKSRLGGNAILAVSLAAAKAAAVSQQKPLYAYVAQLSGHSTLSLPMPLMNILNGGKHAAGSTDIQEFMIMPVSATSFKEALRLGTEVFHSLAKVLSAKGYATTVGDEGGFAPAVKHGNQEALDLIAEAVDKAGYKLGEDILLALDVAASELYEDGKYQLSTERRSMSSSELIEWYSELCQKYPIKSIEDGLAEDDWGGWQQLTNALGSNVQLVGDDLLVTNTAFLERAINNKAGNAILIKPNQIGTLSETIAAVAMAQANNWRSIMSHRSGETEDTTIAHLAVGLNTGQIKTGSLSRTDRVAKYNELLRIEELAGGDVAFNKQIFN